MPMKKLKCGRMTEIQAKYYHRRALELPDAKSRPASKSVREDLKPQSIDRIQLGFLPKATQ